MTAVSLNVAVIFGGPSSEADVSRVSAAGVASGLEKAGHRVTRLELDATLAGKLAGFDVVFPITHGPLGEDGCLQGLLEVLGLPYVGSGVLASALAMDKPRAKAQFRDAGLPVAAEVVLRAGSDLAVEAARARAALGAAVVVKPVSGGSGIGVTRVGAEASLDALISALKQALVLDSTVLVEKFEAGLEVTVAVFERDREGEPVAMPPTLILAKLADWYDFASRYAPGGSEHVCPAPFTPSLTAELQRVAVLAHRCLGARDLSRVDFVVDEATEKVTLLEVNTLPGMTGTSLFPEAVGVAGVAFPELCDRLVRRAAARPRRASPEKHCVPGG